MMEAGGRYVAVVRAWLEGRPVTDVAGTITYADLAAARDASEFQAVVD
jgi:hypothetical protein